MTNLPCIETYLSCSDDLSLKKELEKLSETSFIQVDWLTYESESLCSPRGFFIAGPTQEFVCGIFNQLKSKFSDLIMMHPTNKEFVTTTYVGKCSGVYHITIEAASNDLNFLKEKLHKYGITSPIIDADHNLHLFCHSELYESIKSISATIPIRSFTCDVFGHMLMSLD